MAQKHFIHMTTKQLCAVGDKACKAELKRRGRDSSGKKIGSRAKAKADANREIRAKAKFAEAKVIRKIVATMTQKEKATYEARIKMKNDDWEPLDALRATLDERKAEAIRYLRGLKDYYGPDEE